MVGAAAACGGGAAGASANGSRMQGIPCSTQTLEDVKGWISDVNPNYDPYDWSSPYGKNCGSCAAAVFQRLNGHGTSTASDKTLSIAEMNHLTGLTQTTMSPDQIKTTLINRGPGAHAVIGVDRAEGAGHWFNAFTPDGVNVYTIDGQNGSIGGWPPDYGNVVLWDMSF